MKRLLGQALTITAVGVAATALTPACADNDQSIFVNFVFFPPTNRQNGACIYQADPTQTKMSAGRLDVGLSSTYTATLLVGSQLISRGDTNATRAEPNRIHINGAVVRVTDPNGGAISEFSTLGSGVLNPQANNIAAYAVVSLPVIDSATSAKLNVAVGDRPKEVVANIKVFGKTLGGVDVESGEFQFPISVCKGCLVYFPPGSDDPATAGVDCKAPAAANGAGTTAPCFFGQDESISCQSCQATAYDPVCNPINRPDLF